MDGEVDSETYWDARASALAEFVRPSMTTLVLLELVMDDAQPDKSKWVDQDAVVARTTRLAGWGTTMKETSELKRQLVKTTRRLSGDTLSPTFRLSLAAGAVAISVASGGIALVAGTAIGGTMGLSGAAATSAGLDLLGGGSLAAGGFGVAGGTLLVTGLAKAGYSGARLLAV